MAASSMTFRGWNGLGLIAAGVLLLGLAGVSLLIARAATALPRPRERASVAKTGAYKFVRHPVYGALILIAVGRAPLEDAGPPREEPATPVRSSRLKEAVN